MKPKHITIVTPHYAPYPGGLSAYSEGLATALARQGHRPIIITTNTHHLPFHMPGPIPVYRLSCLQLVGGRLPIPYRVSEIRHIMRHAFPTGSTALIQTRLFPISLLGAVMARLRGARLVVLEHGSGHIPFANPVTGFLFRIYEHTMTLGLKLITPRWYGVSRAASAWLDHFGISSRGEIGNGVDPVSMHTTKREPMILFAGRLVEGKGVMALIEAFKVFHRDNSHYRLVIAGDGELADQVRTSIADVPAITYLGAVDRSTMFDYLSRCAVYVNPTTYPEGMPTILLEAGLCHAPIITTLQGGTEELIEDEVTGYVIGSTSVDAIASALSKVHDHEAHSHLMARRFHDIVIERYSWDAVVDQFLNEVAV